MNGPAPAVVESASRLRAALEDTAAALAGADLDRLLASEALLQKILTETQTWTGSGTGSGSDPARLRTEVEAAQAALRRCRRLGAAVSDFVRISLDARGGGLGYEPARAAAAALTGRTFNERV